MRFSECGSARCSTEYVLLFIGKCSVIESKPAVVKGVIEISIWPAKSRARIDLSISLVELGLVEDRWIGLGLSRTP